MWSCCLPPQIREIAEILNRQARVEREKQALVLFRKRALDSRQTQQALVKLAKRRH